MPEETIVKQCAPTMAGIKTGNLFTCPCEDWEELVDEIKAFNRKYVPKGICLLPIRFHGSRALLYLYRPAGLEQDLKDRLAREILTREGYPWNHYGKCLARLVRRLREGRDFPHEIGLFLSYPPEDVKGFIDNHAENYKYSGSWKVYGDGETANGCAIGKRTVAPMVFPWQQKVSYAMMHPMMTASLPAGIWERH